MPAPSADAFLDEPTPPKADDYLDAPSQPIQASSQPASDDFLDQPGTQERAQQLAMDSSVDPASHAAANPQEYEAAFQAEQLRNNRSLAQKTGAFAKTLATPSTWGSAAVGAGKFGAGLVTAPLNALGQFWHGAAAMTARGLGADDLADSEERKQLRDKAEAVLAGQSIEESLKGAGRTILGWKPHTGATDVTGSMDADFSSPEDQAKADAAANEQRDRAEFGAKVQAARNAAQLASGRPLTGGFVAGLTGATGTPVSELTPEALQQSGAPAVRPFMVQTEAASGNPENLILAAAPELPGTQYLGGKLTQGVGKAAQVGGQGVDLAIQGGRALAAQIRKVPLGPQIAHGVAAIAGFTHAPALATAGGVGAGLKGLQWLGRGLEEQGAAAASGAPSALDTAAANARLSGTGSVLTDTQRVIGDAASRGAATAIGMAPVNLALSGGNPEDLANQTAGAAAFGGVTDLLRSARPALVEAARPALRQKGLESQDTNTREGRASTQFVQQLPEAQRNTVLELQGALAGLPVTNAQGQQVPARLVVQSSGDFANTLKKFGFTNIPEGGGQGFYWGPDGTAYINSDHPTMGAGNTFAHVAGHEFAGHIGSLILQAAGAKGGPIYDGIIRAAKTNLYNPDGAPTPDFQRFLDGYNQAFDPTGKTKEIDPTNQNSVDEFLAETAGQIISRRGVGDIALPPSLLDRVTQGVGTFMAGLTGVDPRSVGNGRFGQKEVADLSESVRDSLIQLAGMKLRPGQGEGAISRPQTPDEYVQELQDTLAKPRPTDTAANVKAWLKEQAQARKELADFQGQASAPTPRAAPTPPSAPVVPPNPDRADAIKGIPAEAAQHVDAAAQALGGTPNSSELLTAATKLRGGGKINPPNVQPATAPQTQPLPSGSTVATARAEPVAAPVAPVQDQTPAGVALGTPDEVAANAEKEAIAQEKYGRANTGAGKKRVQDAKIQALAEAGRQGENDLSIVTNATSDKSLVGDINPENPYHAAILKELGITPDQIKGVTDAQTLSGTPAYIRYRSAKSDTEGTGGEGSAESIGSASKRAEEIEANPAEDRKASTIQHKVAIPLDTSVTKSGGISKRFLVLSDLLHNAQSIFEWMKANGVQNPYGETHGEQGQGLAADAQAYAKNHASGWNGPGTAPMQGFPDTGFPPRDPNYQPTVIPKDRFDVLNAMFNDEKAVKVGEKQSVVDDKKARVDAAKTPAAKSAAQRVYERAVDSLRQSEELQNLNRENGAYFDPASNETNELRKNMKDSGFDPKEGFYSVFQNLSPDHILDVSDKPIPHQPGDVDSIRPSGFDIDPAELAREGLPNQKAIAAGFSPDEIRDKLTPERLLINIRNYGANRTSGRTPTDYREAIAAHVGAGEQGGERQEETKSPDEQAQSITKWADESGVAIRRRPWNLNPTSKNNVGGVEHDTFFDAPSQRWIKTTKLGQFGEWPTVYKKPDGEISWTLSRATPGQYLDRLKGTEELFDLKTPVHGIIVEPTITGKMLPSIVTSQPDIQGTSMIDPEIEDALGKQGFLKIDDGSASYYRKSDNTAILDAHPGNIAKAGGKPIGYDVIVMHPNGELRQLFERDHAKAAVRQPAPKGGSFLDAARARFKDETPDSQAAGFSPDSPDENTDPAKGDTPGERLAREAEAANIPLRAADYISLIRMDPDVTERIRARIASKTGKPARFSPGTQSSPQKTNGQRVVPLASIQAQQRQQERELTH